jgi:hypothetical protein
MSIDSKPPSSDKREMYTEIASLVGAIAKALAIPEAEVAAALEAGTMTLEFGADSNGNRFVAVSQAGKTARVYQGAIKRATPP